MVSTATGDPDRWLVRSRQLPVPDHHLDPRIDLFITVGLLATFLTAPQLLISAGLKVCSHGAGVFAIANGKEIDRLSIGARPPRNVLRDRKAGSAAHSNRRGGAADR